MASKEQRKRRHGLWGIETNELCAGLLAPKKSFSFVFALLLSYPENGMGVEDKLLENTYSFMNGTFSSLMKER